MKVYKPEELAKEWKVSERTVRRLIEAEKIDAIRIGRVWRIPEDEKQRFESKKND
jgi:excisionase family DNA binding protein